MYSHINQPLGESGPAPDTRATSQITQPRGDKDVLMILCFSGGGSRASWFSAATMLRLENVVDEINLLHEVDVISSVSGGGLPAAYYCLSRDPGPYSVVRVETLPEQLPPDLVETVKMDHRRGLLGARDGMTPEQRDRLKALFAGESDRERVDHLFWLSHHNHAPETWQPKTVRELMTRDYITKLLWAIIVPRARYWFTAYDRSDMMAKIFVNNLYGNRLVEIPRALKHTADFESVGWLDRCPEAALGIHKPEFEQIGEDALRWPEAKPVRAPVRLDWDSNHPLAQSAVQPAPGGSDTNRADRVSLLTRPPVAYRFKDLNPERPYLVLNATDGTEDPSRESHFGQVFSFTREDFKEHLNSSVDNYEVAHGVMASAAFPAVFSFVTLKDFRPQGKKERSRYKHVFDGGNADNLGLESAKKIILENRDRYRHFVVISVDSHTKPKGASPYKPDVRGPIVDYFVDYNFLNSFDTLLDAVRSHGLDEFRSGVLDGISLQDRLTFWHLSFDQVRDEPTRIKANKIPTTFKISPENVEIVDRCVADLIRPDHPKLQEILRVLRVSPKPVQAEPAPKPAGGPGR